MTSNTLKSTGMLSLYYQSDPFSLVFRPINNILGFSRETLVAVTTNIEGREWRRRMMNERGNNAEHPRASTSDGFMRDAIGQNITVKQVKYGFRKVCMEFMKRLDPDLPYYYQNFVYKT